MAADAAATTSSSMTEEELTLTVKWSGKEYTVLVCGDDSVAELKRRICQLTNVLPKRQKLLYPKIGNKLSDDSLLLSQLPFKSSLKMTMIGSKNTIMFDDLRRNFVMNPQNGLTIKPFRKAHANRDTDQELVKLTQYLLAIADLDDLSALDHSNWQLFAEDSGKRRRHA